MGSVPGDVADIGAGIQSHEDKEEDADPDADAKPEGQVLPLPGPMKSNLQSWPKI